MRVFAHTDHIVRGYSKWSHEPVVLHNGYAYELAEMLGRMLVGAHPLQFCAMDERETAEEHLRHCRLSATAVYPTTELEEAPMNRQMTARPRGRPRKGR